MKWILRTVRKYQVCVLLTIILALLSAILLRQVPDPAEEEFRKRRDVMLDACASHREGNILEMFVHMPSRLSVCHTPKTGSTFWKRIMASLHNHTGSQLEKKPFKIDRYFVHHIDVANGYTLRFHNPNFKLVASNMTRVAFVRDPYSRLLSAYVDKIILPDSWKDIGQAIYRHRGLEKVNCPYDITFEHFLRYAVFKIPNEHWAPLHKVCNPCVLLPHYIGKMETFSRDAAYILNHVGLGHLLANHKYQDHVEDEIRQLISYHFKLHSVRALNRQCLSTTDLAARLWRVFNLNGYIKHTDKFPTTQVNMSLLGLDIPSAGIKFLDTVLTFYRNNRRTESEWKSQRRAVLMNAYRQVPLDVRQLIRELYVHDFKLFNYDPQPRHLFPELYKNVPRD